MPNMKVLAVSKYGAIDNLIATELPKPESAEGYDLLIKYVQMTIRNGQQLRMLQSTSLLSKPSRHQSP